MTLLRFLLFLSAIFLCGAIVGQATLVASLIGNVIWWQFAGAAVIAIISGLRLWPQYKRGA